MRYLIVGGGIAGTSAAEELRKLDSGAEITLLGEEQHRLYSRVLLPHYVKGKIPRERVFLKKPEWYAERKIEFFPGVRALSIDPKNTFVYASDGREHPYDKLLLVTGADVNLLQEDQRGVSYFRTLDDADHLLKLLQEYEGGRIGIVGGGFIALEYINIFADRGLAADLFLRGEYFFSRFLDHDSSLLVQRAAETDGIKVHTHAGSLHEQDFAILGVGLGIVPELGFAQEAGIEVDGGICTNAYLETSIPNIFSAGDVCAFDDMIAGRRHVVGNWMNATMQGRAVAKTMAGERTAFELVSSYATHCRGQELIFVGDAERVKAEEVRTVGSFQEGGVTQIFLRGGKLVGATLVNRNTDRPAITEAIKNRLSYEEYCRLS